MERTAAGKDHLSYTLLDPIGPVLAISAFNHPMNLRIAEEEANIRDRLAELDLNQATGAQQAAADARVMGAQSVQSGLANLAGAGSTIYEGSELYKNADEQTKQGLMSIFSKKPKAGKPSVGGTSSVIGGVNPAAGVGKPKIKIPTGF